MNQFVTLETFVIQFIILVLVLWVLNKFIFRPYLKYLDEWEDKQKKLEDDYKNIDKLIEGANDEKEKLLAEARKSSDSIISNAESVGNKKRISIIEKAEKDGKDLVAASNSEIEKERLTMLNGVKTKLINLILKFNTKLFGEEKISKEYLEKELGKIS